MIGLTPRLLSVRPVHYGVLELVFADGLQGTAEVAERLRGPVFAHARTAAGFFDVSLDPETHAPVWPGGADLAPDVLYAEITSRSSTRVH